MIPATAFRLSRKYRALVDSCIFNVRGATCSWSSPRQAMQRIHGCNGLNNQFDPPNRFSSTAMARGSGLPPLASSDNLICQRTQWRGTERKDVRTPCGTPLNIKHPIRPKPDEHLWNTACYTAYDPRKNGWLGTLDQLNSQKVRPHSISDPHTAFSFILLLSHAPLKSSRCSLKHAIHILTLLSLSHICSHPHPAHKHLFTNSCCSLSTGPEQVSWTQITRPNTLQSCS